MRAALRKLALFLALALAFNLLTVAALPRLINALVMHRMVKLATAEADNTSSGDAALPGAEQRRAAILASGGYNVALPARRADASARTVVRPSPDLLYTVCVFDLSKGDLQISAPVPDSYASVSGFAADSSNFFAVNDRTATISKDGRKRFELLLTRRAAPAAATGTQVVVSPSDRGLVLFRTLITDDSALPGLQAGFQSQQHCILKPR